MQKMGNYVILATPLALAWVALTNIITLESYLVGYVVSLGVVILGVRTNNIAINPVNLPQRVLAFVSYSFFMLWQVWISGIAVSKLVFGLRPIQPGIIAVPIGDDTNNEFIAGASAHSITITPGELVVEYDKECKVMYVHCIDIEQSLKTLESAQAYRLSVFKRIIGS